MNFDEYRKHGKLNRWCLDYFFHFYYCFNDTVDMMMLFAPLRPLCAVVLRFSSFGQVLSLSLSLFPQVEQVVVDLCQCIKLQNSLTLSPKPYIWIDVLVFFCTSVFLFLFFARSFVSQLLGRCAIAWFFPLHSFEPKRLYSVFVLFEIF